MTTPKVAARLGRSLAWVKRHAHDLGGRLVGGAYQFQSVEIERRRTTVEKITFGGGPKPDRSREVGALAARAFPLFRATVPLDEIVERLECEADAVLRLHEQWLRCRQRTTLWLASETSALATAAQAAPSTEPP